jgi:FMN-dependent NADH-azoreductase
MIINLEEKERDLLVLELEKTAIPQIRELIASGSMRKNSRDEMKQEEDLLKTLVEKLKKAA